MLETCLIAVIGDDLNLVILNKMFNLTEIALAYCDQ